MKIKCEVMYIVTLNQYNTFTREIYLHTSFWPFHEIGNPIFVHFMKWASKYWVNCLFREMGK